MPETEKTKTNSSFSRKASLADFFDGQDPTQDSNSNNKNNKNRSDADTVAKNQQEFGQRKRIKP
jgi:hypothetical protein